MSVKLYQKSTDFNAVFTVRFTNEQHMRQYELHPLHLINVATLTLPRESQNTENVTLQLVIFKFWKSNKFQFLYSFYKSHFSSIKFPFLNLFSFSYFCNRLTEGNVQDNILHICWERSKRYDRKKLATLIIPADK